LGIWV
jgi:hypothetical protein